MIPKVIHYCWFGPLERNQEMLECIASWRKLNPDFEIKEWNEINFPFETFPFASKMYNEKKWAFVADYARLHVLAHEGGFYLDTDMLLLKQLSPLADHACVLGEESAGVISAGMIGATAHHPFIMECLAAYDANPEELMTIPRMLSKVYADYPDKESLTVLPYSAFYPFDSEHIKNYHGEDLGDETYGVHLWHYSWGHPLNRFFKKTGIHSIGTRIAEALGIKAFLKKILGFI